MGSHLVPEEDGQAAASPPWTPLIPPRSSSRAHAGSGDGGSTPRVSSRPVMVERFLSMDHELSQSLSPIPLIIEEGNLSDENGSHRSKSPRIPSRLSFDRPASTPSVRTRSSVASTYQTNATSLYPLQARDGDVEGLEPLNEEELDPASFDLLAPISSPRGLFSLEKLSQQLFSREHLEAIFADPFVLQKFASFVRTSRATSVPLLVYYLDAVKALKAVEYANSVMAALGPLEGLDFSSPPTELTVNKTLQEKADQAFEELVREELPAFITHTWIRTASLSIKRRITGTLSTHLRQMSEGLAEVFCLTDPTREDNPIVFASEEFYRTTQYGRDHVLGRNCRFLQGPMTNATSIERLRRNLASGKEYCETILNYRRDGSPFMNLLMCAPLLDSRGTTCYMIGAQIDVSGLAKDCAGLDSLHTLVDSPSPNPPPPSKDPLRDLSAMFSAEELETVRAHGGTLRRLHEGIQHEEAISNWQKPRVVIQDSSQPRLDSTTPFPDLAGGRLAGAYENYLLVRPYPNLKILFASPPLRIPGTLQSPFLSKIGGSEHIKEEITRAFEDGTVVTARIRWVSRHDKEGRPRWIHCTPLTGSNGKVGVWVVVIVDDEEHEGGRRSWKVAPRIEPGRASRSGNGNGRTSRNGFDAGDSSLEVDGGFRLRWGEEGGMF
ncbi:hypothetical protein B0T16DRAFT_107383 [Cercophora newfieldiana]|uniref:PAS domain-containing protein n=1 Tax=Cercophora newfieldiana TaxID=92897 RepID=A0AA39YHU4_9PEZI|nr:hypothetical protein B0T16DRAFT_107383 [Cercophora newfieldiana]